MGMAPGQAATAWRVAERAGHILHLAAAPVEDMEALALVRNPTCVKASTVPALPAKKPSA